MAVPLCCMLDWSSEVRMVMTPAETVARERLQLLMIRQEPLPVETAELL